MSRETLRPRTRDRRSFVQLWFAIMGFMLIGFMGLAIDAGYMVYTGNQLQGAAEAAALAGAQQMYIGPSAARDAAVAMGPLNSAGGVAIQVNRNDANTPTGDLVLGTWDAPTKTFTPAGSNINACKVVARRDSTRNGQLSLWFASAFGAGSMDMTRTAIAVSAGVGENPALAVLDNTNTSGTLNLLGSFNLDVNTGAIHVNSHSASGASIGGSAAVRYGSMYVTGSGYSGDWPGRGIVGTNTTPVVNAAEIADPLILVPEPSTSGMTTYHPTFGNQNVTLNPGYYPDGWNISRGVTLNPGIYVVGTTPAGTGRVTALSGGSQCTITGTNVMIYLKPGCDIRFNGANTSLQLTPPDPDVNNYVGADTYKGIAIFMSRDRTHGVGSVVMPLAGGITFTGVYYYPYAAVDINASGNNDIARLICWQFSGHGSATVTVHWDGVAPPIASPTYLVQ